MALKLLASRRGSGGVAGRLGVGVEGTLHGSSLLVAQLEAGLSTSGVESRGSVGDGRVAAVGEMSGIRVVVASGDSLSLRVTLVVVGHATVEVRLGLVGLLHLVGVRVSRVELGRVVHGGLVVGDLRSG